MSQAEEAAQETSAGKALVRLDQPGGNVEWADLRSAASWARKHRVMLAAIVLIVIQLAWKAQFLNHLYFRQDDFHDLNLAIEHPFSWGYLTFIGAGHLIIGLRAVAWVLARTTLYNWGLASAVSLAFVAAASFAAFRLLKTLFGDRPAILVPLAFYLLTPLTLPDLGWWSSAMESVPLQLATFMAMTAHVYYVRTNERRHLAAAAFWLIFGLIFFEKALVLPPLLFAITSGFLVERRGLLAGARQTLAKYRQAWLAYITIMIGYLILLFVSLNTSASTPQAPNSLGGALQFAGLLVRDTFLPGAIGGPWRWYPLGGGSYALASAPTALIWLSLAVAAAVLVVSVGYRRIAWRAWVILIGWIVVADMVPVIAGRINAIAPIILGLETRYLADAAPILAVCIGLAFWPVIGAARTSISRSASRSAQTFASQPVRSAAAALIGVFVFGSLWSVQAYESVTTGLPARTYLANAEQALAQVPRGTNVLDRPVPADMVVGLFGRFSLESTVVGDLATGKLAGKVRWISRPEGTINKLYMFSTDGRLYPAWVYPTVSLPRTKAQGCWPERHGQIVVKFWQPSSIYTGIMRIGYIWFAKYSSFITIKFGQSVKTLKVLPGLNTGFVSVSGGYVRSATVTGLGGLPICVGDIEVGNLEPAKDSKPIPGVLP